MKDYVAQFVIVVAPLGISYFAGLVHIEAFLSYFSISINEIDLSTAEIASYSFIAISYKSLFVLTIIAILLFLFENFFEKYNIEKAIQKMIRTIVYLAFVVVAVLAVHSEAISKARERVNEIWSGSQGGLVFNETKMNIDKMSLVTSQRHMLEYCLEKQPLRFIIASQGRDYVFCRASRGDYDIGLILVMSSTDDKIGSIRNVRRPQ